MLHDEFDFRDFHWFLSFRYCCFDRSLFGKSSYVTSRQVENVPFELLTAMS